METTETAINQTTMEEDSLEDFDLRKKLKPVKVFGSLALVLIKYVTYIYIYYFRTEKTEIKDKIERKDN